MKNSRLLRGIELRYVLTMHLFLHGPATITDLFAALDHHGFGVVSPSPKSVSDALRWERRRGRVRRLARGRYGPGRMPRGTEYRIHRRVPALRAEAAQSLGGGHDRHRFGERLE
ncbi:hypothetical protein [Mycobacterium sp.]|uniref:hypothetical protein n=1 Tax=Mycobacterium sp. TaxID=1785 RepID=UPI001277046E|nr:hypothetical protein [Mycobacterium sp.]KAA8957956.1 MAG: hypothetical protein F6Q13_15790 [Mycobacterium sp.]